MPRNTDHRVTARSTKVGTPWHDRRNREWQTFTCGVTAHGQCTYRINHLTGYKLKEER